ncbi:transglycosylase family protein [Actinacidiphila sp. DG2A-62]|jgi:hypothetical protein|uniref:transglycosylase family protein n=1 Tax=Actinacidiphila sp. DG2A-62 TaxID=3108821 RepID=UPI002DB764A0|nr:transglycosylase family protein [Actinacidiphila sp. DG2A-62]MEC3993283.1 transglycosylase family protein [Actinacidiphila sp. DG2A-62]
MIELSNCRQITSARRSSRAGSTAGLRAATAAAVLGAASLLPLMAQPATAAASVRQTAAPPARAGQAAPGGTAFAGTPQDAAASAPSAAASAPSAAHTAHTAHRPASAAAPASADTPPATAPAVSSPVWSDLAMCESSGDWHINSGNGFYGGLQFWQPTWERFGGRAYARRADLASRDHQISIARKVLRAQGWQAWPVCSRKLDLPARTASSGSSGSSAAGPGGSAASSAGKGQAANGSGGGAHHTVARGETLSGIAVAYHVPGGWKRLYEMNKSVIGPDPNRVAAGTVLTLPRG